MIIFAVLNIHRQALHDDPTLDSLAPIVSVLEARVGSEAERCPDVETQWATATSQARKAGYEDAELVRPNERVLARFIDPKQGFGCFARVGLEVGDRIPCPGFVSAHEEGLERRNYCVDLGQRKGHRFSVSPYDSVAAGYANDARFSDRENNVQFLSEPQGRGKPVRVYWRVLRPIAEGEELLGSYGAAYWEHWTGASGEQTADMSAWMWRLVHELRGCKPFPIVVL